jgi:hypothetical protein
MPIFLFLFLFLSNSNLSDVSLQISSNSGKKSEICANLLKCLQNSEFYPLIMLCCWVPHICVFIMINNDDYLKVVAFPLVQISFSWGALYGLFMAVLFFTRSKESKMLWSLFIFKEKSPYSEKSFITNTNAGAGVSDRVSSISISSSSSSGNGSDSVTSRNRSKVAIELELGRISETDAANAAIVGGIENPMSYSVYDESESDNEYSYKSNISVGLGMSASSYNRNSIGSKFSITGTDTDFDDDSYYFQENEETQQYASSWQSGGVMSMSMSGSSAGAGDISASFSTAGSTSGGL